MAGQVRGVKGTRVLLPPDSAVWAEVEAIARRVFTSYGFGEIRTPMHRAHGALRARRR